MNAPFDFRSYGGPVPRCLRGQLPSQVPTQCPPTGRPRLAWCSSRRSRSPSVQNRGEAPNNCEAAGRSVAHCIPESTSIKCPTRRCRATRPSPDRPPALVECDEIVNDDPRLHGCRRGQARGLGIRSLGVPRARRISWPRHQRYEHGDVATTMAAVKLMSEGFEPDRDIIFFYSGDEQTRVVGRDARLRRSGATSLMPSSGAMPTGVGAAPTAFSTLGFGISMAAKTFQTYFFTTEIPGGLAPARARQRHLRPCRFAGEAAAPIASSRCRTHIRRGYFEERARQEGNSALGQQIRALAGRPSEVLRFAPSRPIRSRSA